MSKVVTAPKERIFPFNWLLWRWFLARQRLSWNFLLPAKVTYKGRFWLISKKMKFPPPDQRIYFSGSSDFSPFP